MTTSAIDTFYVDTLTEQLGHDLNFHGEDSGYASHDFHSFPAKFPPQLPHKFIEALTSPGDVVLDPMMGSGTTIVEAFFTGRFAVGFDIDPLAIMLSRAKVATLDSEKVAEVGTAILEGAQFALEVKQNELEEKLRLSYDPSTKKFIDYWFAPVTQLELQALVNEIEDIADPKLRSFFQLVFSGVIITKTGGVSLAFDLAHTRPHRAKIVKTGSGDILLGHDLADSSSPRIQLLTKTLKPALTEFEKRLQRTLSSLLDEGKGRIQPSVQYGNAQHLPLKNNCVDLIVTSPPYAANAIDYMRAHKFSLVWLGYPVDKLGQLRKKYIGGEATTDVRFEELPELPKQIVAEVSNQDAKRGKVVHRYYSEMTRTLQEMYRVLRPGKAAIVVAGTSVIQGIDIQIGDSLAEIGAKLGFDVPKIGFRDLDRDRRMLPASTKKADRNGQIEQRMHDEYVIGFHKP